MYTKFKFKNCRQYWVGDYAQLYAIYDWGRNMRFEKCSFICFFFQCCVFLSMCDMYIKLVSNPINHIWEILAVKKWPPFLHLWSWYLIFWRTIVEMWIVNCKKLPMKTFNALLICNWILSKLLIIHCYLPGSKGLLTD